MFKTDLLREWVAFVAHEKFQSPADTSTEFSVRAVEPVGAWVLLDADEVLVGSGTDFTVKLTEVGAVVLQLRPAREPDHNDALGSIRFVQKGESRVVKLPHELETFTVVKHRVVESDEMRTMRRMMLEAQQRTEVALTAMAENFAKQREEAMMQPPEEEIDDEPLVDAADAADEAAAEVAAEAAPAAEPAKPAKRAKAAPVPDHAADHPGRAGGAD